MYYSDDDTKTNLLSNDEIATLKGYTDFSEVVLNNTVQLDLSSYYQPGRNFTFEVTYQKNNYRNIYSNINLLNNYSYDKSILLSTSNNNDRYFLDNTTNPSTSAYYYKSNYNKDFGPALLEEADSITITLYYYFDLFENTTIACYKRNADGSKGEQLNCTLTQQRGRVNNRNMDYIFTLSGIRNAGDIIIEAEIFNPETSIYFAYDGLHPGRLDITSIDTASVAANPDSCSNITGSYSNPSGLYTDGTYSILYTDNTGSSRIKSIEYTYVTYDGAGHDDTVSIDVAPSNPNVLWKENDGKYCFKIPIMKNSNANPNTGNVYEKMIIVHFEQLETENGFYRFTDEFEEQYKGRLQLKGSTTSNHADSDSPILKSRNTNGGTSTSYDSYYEDNITVALNNDLSVYLRAGKEYTISDKYTYFKKKRLELKSLTVYEIDGQGNIKTDENDNPVTVALTETATESGAVKSWKFTMPHSNIKAVPIYEDHMHTIKVQTNKARGSVTLTSDKTPYNNYFYNSFYNFSSYEGYYYNSESSAYENYSDSYNAIIDGRTLTLTATPASSYKLMDVKAFVVDENRLKTVNQMTDITTDSEGNVTGSYTEVPNLVFEPVEGQENTYTIELPGGVDDDDDTGKITTKSFIIYVQFGTDATFAPVKFTLDQPLSTDYLIPGVQLWGAIKDNSNGYVQAILEDSAATLTTADDLSANVDTPLTVKMGIYASKDHDADAMKNSKFVYSNFKYTVNNATTGEKMFSFLYHIGNSTENETEDSHTTFIDGDEALYNQILTQKPVAQYGYKYYDNDPDYAEMKQAVTTTFVMALPEYGLDIHMSISETYTPIVVNQYIIGADGTVAPVADDDGFRVFVDKYSNTTNTDAYRQKYFTKYYPQNYYSLLDNVENFESSYTVSKASETRWMLTESTYTGAYIKPTPKPGYMLSGVTAVPLDRDGNVLEADNYGMNGPKPLRYYSYFDSNSNRLCYQFYQTASYYASCYSRSQQMQVNVYYALDSSLTVYQHTTSQTDQSNTSTQLEIINVTAYDTPENSVLSNPFIDNGKMFDEFLLYTYGKHVSKTTSSWISDLSVKDGDTYKWNSTTGINQGYKLQFSVETKGSNRIKSVSAYKSDGTQLTVNRTSGNGHAGTTTIYQIQEATANGDNITFDIEYTKEQYLTVEVKELNSSNNLIDNRVDYTKGTVTVTGTPTDNSSVLPFYDAEDNRKSTFNVTTTYTTLAEYNTKVTVNTNFSSDNGYVVANVYAYNLDVNNRPTGNPLEIRPLAVDSSITDEEAYNFKQCVLNGLTPDTNVKITVILAKTCSLRVAVHTANDAGIYGDGLKTGDPNSYVNFSATNSTIGMSGEGAKVVVTAYSEGNYNTSEITVHDNPYYRNLNVIQASNINGWVQLPVSGDYVVSKIVYKYVSGGVTYTPSTDTSASGLYVFKDNSSGNEYLRYNFSAATDLKPGNEKYFVDVYVAPAKSIHTKMTLEDANESSGSQCGDVYVNGVNNVDPQVTKPFTQIVPKPVSGSYNLLSNRYYAYNSNKADGYIKQVKCVRDTEISLDITPRSNQIISQVNVTLGSWDGPAVEVEAGEENPNTHQVTYTLKQGSDNFRMPALNDLYIYVVFAPDINSTVKLDLMYTDDYSGWKPLTDLSGSYDLKIEATNNSHMYNNVSFIKNESTDNTDNEQTITDISHQYNVKAGTYIRIKVRKKDNESAPWYLVTDRWVSYENAGQDIPDDVSRGGSITYAELGKTINSDQTAVFHMRFVPVSKIVISDINNNFYHTRVSQKDEDILASNQSDYGTLKLVASNENVPDYAPAPMFHYEGAVPVWRNDVNSAGDEMNIIKGSSLVFSVDETSIEPGYTYSVKLFRDDVEVPGAFVKDEGASGEQANNRKVAYYNFQGVTEPDHKYRVEFTYDRTEFYTYVEGAQTNIYMVYTDSAVTDGRQINVYDRNTYTNIVQVRNTGHTRSHDERLDESWSNIGGNTFVMIEVFAPKEEVYIGTGDHDAYFADYADHNGTRLVEHDIRQTLNNNYFRIQVNGYYRYFYWYQLNPEDTYSFDNSHLTHVIFKRDINSPTVEPKPDPETEATINLAQFKRDDRNEIVDANEPTDGTVVMCNKSGRKLIFGTDEVDSVGLPIFTSANTGIANLTCTSYVDQYLNFTVTPAPNQIVSKVEVIDLSGYTFTMSPKSKDNGVYTYELLIYKTFYTINVYYSEPRVTVSFNNENNSSSHIARGEVYVDTVDGAPFIENTRFMNGFYTDRGSSRQLIIVPETYVNNAGETKYYELDAILYGDARDNMLAIDPSLYSLSEETGVITIYLNDIQSDIDVDIRLRKEDDPKTSRLIVSHYIMMGDGYQLCDELSHGEVTVTAKNNAKTEAIQLINSENENVDSLSLTTEGTIIGSAYADSYLYFNVLPPSNYKIAEVKGRYASTDVDNQYSESLIFTKSDGDNGSTDYALTSDAPDSGVIYVDVYYDLYRYNLDFNFTDRYGEEKTYHSSGSLTIQEAQGFMNSEGKIVLSEDFIMGKAPFESNFSADFRWQGDADEGIVRDVDSSGNPTAVVSDSQTDKPVVINYKTTDDENVPYKRVSVPYGKIVKVDSEDGESYKADGSYIFADEKDSDDNEFSYWKIEKNAENGGEEMQEITRCYSRKFNYAAMGDYTITPVYEGKMSVTSEPKSASLSLLQYSRNQWTDENNEKTAATDRLYADFEVAFRDNGKLINSEDWGDSIPYTCGVVFEVCDKLEEEAAMNFAEDLQEIDYETDLDNLKASIKSNADKCDGRTLIYQTIDKTKLTNKNRLELFQGFGNTTKQNADTGETELNNALFVIKVYSYMIKEGSGEVVLSQPVYINLYDIATAEYSFNS